MPRPRPIVLQFLLVCCLMWMALYIYVPNLPVYAQSKTSDLALVGLALSQYGLWQALVRLPLGIVADWLGRRKIFIGAALLFTALGAFLMSSAPGIEQVTLGRALTGLGAAGWVPLVVAWSSLFPPAQAARAAATLTLANSVSRVLASLLTGPAFALGGYPLEFGLAIGAAGLGILVLLPGRELRTAPRPPSLASTGRLVTRKAVLGPALLNAVLLFGNYAASFSFVPILAKNLGASDVDQGSLTTLSLLAYTLGNWAAGALVGRISERTLLYGAFGGVAIGLGWAALASSLPSVYLLMAWLGLAAGTGYPILMGQSLAPVDVTERNTAVGLHQAVYALGMFGGPWAAGILASQLGLPLMFGLIGLAVGGVGIGGVWYLNRPRA